MDKVEAKALRRKKDGIQMMIYNCVKLKQDAKELVIEYHKILNELVSNGYQCVPRSEYLKLDYWGLTPNDVINGITKSQVVPIITNEINKYIFTLAWTESYNSQPMIFILELVREYLKDMGLEEIGLDRIENENIECSIKYKYKCSEDEFKVIKRSTNILLDIVTKSNPNVAFFGKKHLA